MRKQGFDVYLIDWILPRPDDKQRGFDAYVNLDISDAVRALEATIRERCTGAGGAMRANLPEWRCAKSGMPLPLQKEAAGPLHRTRRVGASRFDAPD